MENFALKNDFYPHTQLRIPARFAGASEALQMPAPPAPDEVLPSIFGAGIVAAGALPFLPGARVFSDACSEPQPLGFGAFLLPAAQFRPQASALELISPGIAPHHALARAARRPFSELDFFAPALPPCVYISGTNGKTTTTELAARLLGTEPAGNIGRSLAAVLGQRLAVLEQSSFCLHYTRAHAPEVYALLDVAPDHLGWHGSFEAYLAAKLSPLERMLEGSLAIVPAWLSGRFRTRARVVFYSHEADLARAFRFDLKIIYKYFSGVIALDAAVALSIALWVNGGFDEALLASFRPGAHRCEIFSAAGLNFCDDSKATNAHATEACLRSLLPKYSKIHLLIGGDAKGQDLNKLLTFCKQTGRIKLYGIGKADNGELLRRYDSDARWSSELCAAVALAAVAARASAGGVGGAGAGGAGGAGGVGGAGDEIIVLSPACASLDQFGSYAERGEVFCAAARGL